MDKTRCGDECSEQHTYSGRCQLRPPPQTHPPFETCDDCQHPAAEPLPPEKDVGSTDALRERHPDLWQRIGDALVQCRADHEEQRRKHGPNRVGPDPADYVLAVVGPELERLQNAQTDSTPQAAVVELLEPRPATTNTTAGSIVVPSHVRINGKSVLTPEGSVVRISDARLRNDAVVVTVPMLVRHLVVGAEGDMNRGRDA